MPGSGGGGVFVENPPNHRRENLPKNKRALWGQATGRYRWRSDRIRRGKNRKMSTLSPFVKVAAGAGALVLGYLGYRYDAVPSYFLLTTVDLWSFTIMNIGHRYCRCSSSFDPANFYYFKLFSNTFETQIPLLRCTKDQCITKWSVHCWHARIGLDLKKGHGRAYNCSDAPPLNIFLFIFFCLKRTPCRFVRSRVFSKLPCFLWIRDSFIHWAM